MGVLPFPHPKLVRQIEGGEGEGKGGLLGSCRQRALRRAGLKAKEAFRASSSVSRNRNLSPSGLWGWGTGEGSCRSF